jgi:hypothetical protein
MWSLAVAVEIIFLGDDPDSISSVLGIDGASWNNKRLAGVTRIFQVR